MAKKIQAVSKSGILAKTAVNAMTGTANNINNAAFSAGSWNGFINNLSSKKQWQSLGISSVGSLVTNGLGNKIQGTNFNGYNGIQIEQINSIAGTVGGLTTNALEWLTFGETTFNLANLSMFGIEYGSMWGTQGIQNLSGGLLSMTIGSTGPSFAISSSGTDISVGTLYSNALGLSHAIENARIENYSDGKISTILRMQYGYGDKESKALLEEILTGKTKLVLEEKTTETTAQTTRDQDGRKTITMYTSGENQSIEELFMQGIILQHEAHRDGIVSDEQTQYTETINAVLGHTVMAKKIQNDSLYKSIMDDVIAKNLNLQNDLAVFDHAVETGDWGAFGSYVNAAYDSSADYWRVLSNGDLYDDGLDDRVSFEDGRDTIYYGKKSKQGTLEKFLGLESGTGYKNLLKESGYSYINGKWVIDETKNPSKTISREKINEEMTNISVASEYYLFRDIRENLNQWHKDYLDEDHYEKFNADMGKYKLKEKQESVIKDENYQQGSKGPFGFAEATSETTWCNMATQEVTFETSYELSMALRNENDPYCENTNANDMYDNLMKAALDPNSSIVEITPQQAQALANQGYTVVGSWKNSNPDLSGHIATVEAGHEYNSETGPYFGNVGRSEYTGTGQTAYKAFGQYNYQSIKYYYNKDQFKNRRWY